MVKAKVAALISGGGTNMAALLYASRRKEKRKEPEPLPLIPGDEAPETD